ncbi:transcriptional regulator of acetoin/glycerol metabolism [Mycetocola sp. BIGb0189]|uniref:GAF domain-containing protein n=1 Tax=Mycetocola sp. BIGb0189 TaxID=2940604 RepID=UPI00216A06B1|nr:GAF domain-containing protein [Mycetocola sp. BIGb0189]MCS4277572.1 transcriptional regulator of acetoin/glycerol metabolism [Mycetocola sp. BIGb0189]
MWSTVSPTPGQSELVRQSWSRSAAHRVDPAGRPGRTQLTPDELHNRRTHSPLTELIPIARALLLGENARDGDALVALGDADGTLLWVEGDHDLRDAAESMSFMPGTDWSEAAVGTSAPGTALALERPVRVHHGEHFASAAKSWSCLAVPLRDPETGTVLGVLDLTDRTGDIRTHGERLLIATAYALQQELLVRRLREKAASPHRSVPVLAPDAAPCGTPSLDVLGRDLGVLRGPTGEARLSARHAEILTLLAWHPQGLTAERLADLLYERKAPLVTLRAEIVRLRRVLAEVGISTLGTRPYRLDPELDTDVRRVLCLLDRGAHRRALAAFTGDVLPSSRAPGILTIREQVRERLRESLLTGAAVEPLLEFARGPHGIDDLEIWRMCLHLLPACSPRRAGVLREITRITRELDGQVRV